MFIIWNCMNMFSSKKYFSIPSYIIYFCVKIPQKHSVILADYRPFDVFGLCPFFSVICARFIFILIKINCTQGTTHINTPYWFSSFFANGKSISFTRNLHDLFRIFFFIFHLLHLVLQFQWLQ